MSDLSFVDTNELLAELMGRYDHAAFTGLKSMDSGNYVAKGKWIGNPHTVIGMCVELQDKILDIVAEHCEDIDSEEPGDEDERDISQG